MVLHIKIPMRHRNQPLQPAAAVLWEEREIRALTEPYPQLLTPVYNGLEGLRLRIKVWPQSLFSYNYNAAYAPGKGYWMEVTCGGSKRRVALQGFVSSLLFPSPSTFELDSRVAAWPYFYVVSRHMCSHLF